MAWTTSQLEALESAIAQGTLTVEYADKKVTYRSLEDMLRLRDLMRRELLSTSATGSSARVKMKFSKGLDE